MWNEEMGDGGWGWIIEAGDLTEEEGMRMGWLLSWKRVAVETVLFPDRQTIGQAGTRGLTAECVKIKGVCGYETAAATPTHTHTLCCTYMNGAG